MEVLNENKIITLNPFNEQTLKEYNRMTDQEMEEAVDTSHTVFLNWFDAMKGFYFKMNNN